MKVERVLSSLLSGNMHEHYTNAFTFLQEVSIPEIVGTYGTFTTMVEGTRYKFTISNTHVDPLCDNHHTIQDCINLGTNYLFRIVGTVTISTSALGSETWVPVLTKVLDVAHIPMMTESTHFGYSGAFVCRGKLRTVPMTRTIVPNIPILRRKKGQIHCQVRSVHLDKIYRSTSTLELILHPGTNIISVKIPFQPTPISLYTIIRALGSTIGDFFAEVRLQAGSLYDPFGFRPYEIQCATGTTTLDLSQHDATMAISKLAGKCILSTGLNVLFNEVLPHLRLAAENSHVCPRTNLAKLTQLSICVCEMILLGSGCVKQSGRDGYTLSRVVTSADHIGSLFRLLFINHMRTCGKLFRRSIINQETTNITTVDLVKVYGEHRLSARIISAVSSGSWSKLRRGVSMSLNTNNNDAIRAQLRRISSALASTDGTHTDPRSVQLDQYGFVCAASTPDGETTGLVYEMAFTATLTPPASVEERHYVSTTIRQLLLPYQCDTGVYVIDPLGVPLFRVRNEDQCIHTLREARRSGTLPQWCIIWSTGRVLSILLQGGILSRPLLIFPVPDKSPPIPPGCTMSWFILHKFVEYISPMEQTSICKIAVNANSCTNTTTHMEISEASFLGHMAATVPFATGQQGPRLAYFTGQKRQVITAEPKEFCGAPMRTELWHTHRPLVETLSGTFQSVEDRALRSTPVVLAFMALQDNQEDAIIMKRSMLQRGAFMASTTRTYISELTNPSTTYCESFQIPNAETSTETYTHLDPNGLPGKGTTVDGGATVIGKVRMVRTSQSNEVRGTQLNTQWKDISTYARHDEGGIVTHSHIYEMPHGKRAHVDVRTVRPTIVGDKFTTSYAQKGVVGSIWADVDLPFSMTTGIIPDVIVSPLSLTSRMTMSSLIEALTGKAVCVTGKRGLGLDEQAYMSGSTEHTQEMEKVLVEHGFAADGTEVFVDGRTGQRIQTRLFVGCVDMFRLVHLASKKIHARSTGPRDPLTRQPKDGRKFGGGLRVGEMESSAIVAHGATHVLQERFRELSDGFDVHICTLCGIMIDDVSTEVGYAYCTRCQSTSSTKTIRIPFTFHIMLLELLSAGVSVRFGVDDILRTPDPALYKYN